MRRVIKIGGSLLARPDLQNHLPKLLNEIDGGIQRDTTSLETLLIVGGGNLVDVLRQWDQLRPLDPLKTHWQCIELLQYTFEVISDWFPGWNRIDSSEAFQDALNQGFSTAVPSLVSIRSFYGPDNDGDLPLDWRTTSDSLAGKLCSDANADELVLLKSCPIDEMWDSQTLISQGIIDEAFAAFRDRTWKLRIASATAYE
ncbi:hypothetical protein SH528x_005179 [Novipirellula sp. SH528]|uniref:hypothetical protein n=1 Tax=Novipirellula sp. SH528 TaxID=3454466 RepID=UPI003FA07353